MLLKLLFDLDKYQLIFLFGFTENFYCSDKKKLKAKASNHSDILSPGLKAGVKK